MPRRVAAAVAIALAPPLAGQVAPPVPDTSGWGVHVLTIAQAPDSSVWVGTYGQGIFVWRPDETRGAPAHGGWVNLRASDDTADQAISWDFVQAFGFGSRGEIWYGTLGNGWGLSTDGGRTWRNWEYRELGPEWQYVAPDGIVTRGDTVYVATADGIKVTWDNGASWREIADASDHAEATPAGRWGTLPNEYVLSLQLVGGTLHAQTLRGGARSDDGGRTWQTTAPGDRCTVRSTCAGLTAPGMRRLLGGAGGIPADPWAAEVTARAGRAGLLGTRAGLVASRGDSLVWPDVPRPARVAAADPPAALRHTWFRRPIARGDNAFIDQTYRFGSTMGGNFMPHQGVEFNNPDGTPVLAAGDGVVAFAGEAESGALTVAIRHDRQFRAPDGARFVFTVYYHHSRLLVRAGDRVRAGDPIALAGNTGRATNDHLHFEVHLPPVDSVALVVDPEVRYPPYNANPELWIAPLPGTGAIAGQVWDSGGRAVGQARIYGLATPEPRETPLSFVETYGLRNRPDPAYGEHFAIGDVPPADYVLGVEIDGRRVFRRVRVEAGKLTWVEFR